MVKKPRAKILKCPFCGNSMTLVAKDKQDDLPPQFYVVCQICGASGPKTKRKSDAVKNWNFGVNK